MRFFQENAPTENASFWTKDWTDQYKVNFGEWADQSVDWIDINLEWLLNIIKWPFDFLLSNVVEGFLEQRGWWLIVLLMFFIGWAVRSFRVGLFALVVFVLRYVVRSRRRRRRHWSRTLA